jgi:hypothetical protein
MPNAKKDYSAEKKQLENDYKQEKEQIKEQYQTLKDNLANFFRNIKRALMQLEGTLSSPTLATDKFPEKQQDQVDIFFTSLRLDYQISEKNPDNLVDLGKQFQLILPQAETKRREKLSELKATKEEKLSTAKNRYSQFKVQAESSAPIEPQEISPKP